MIEISNALVTGFEAAIRGMRNPMNSWKQSDSLFNGYVGINDYIGKKDLELMKKLSKAGNDHGKFLRMINVSLDINAPLYWWKEFDTYKVGTVANSCSTMHKIHSKEFTLDDFSCEHLFKESDEEMTPEFYDVEGYVFSPLSGLEILRDILNACRQKYLETKDKKWWWQMIQLLPSSYNQKRTVVLNYAVLKNMYHARKEHKLDEWREFCKWIESLPYSQIITEC